MTRALVCPLCGQTKQAMYFVVDTCDASMMGFNFVEAGRWVFGIAFDIENADPSASANRFHIDRQDRSVTPRRLHADERDRSVIPRGLKTVSEGHSASKLTR